MPEDKKTCFVISPIGTDESDIRKRSDQILKHVLKPAADSCGFKAIRADDLSEPGMITSQVIQHVIDDPLVVADLTGMNPNVFYELAIRHAIRKPLIQIIQKNEKFPFDVAGMRTVGVDHTDLDSVEDAKNEIVKQINVIMKKKPEEIESPISVSLELQALRHSDNPEERSFAKFISTVTELRSDIANIAQRLSAPENLIPPSYFSKFVDLPERRLLEHRESQLHELKMVIENCVFRIRKIMNQEHAKNQTSNKVRIELDQLLTELSTIMKRGLD